MILKNLKHSEAGNFFLLAGPCVIEGEDMALKIAEKVVTITDKLQIPYVLRGRTGKRIAPGLILYRNRG